MCMIIIIIILLKSNFLQWYVTQFFITFSFRYMALGVALRFVMEALQKPHGSKMYYFGIVALDRFRSRLKEYPRYCQHLMAIQHFNEFPPHLIEVRNFFFFFFFVI